MLCFYSVTTVLDTSNNQVLTILQNCEIFYSRHDLPYLHLQGDYEVKVNLDTDNLRDLRNKLSSETGIPAHVLHVKWVKFYTYACLVNSFYFFFLVEKQLIIFPLNDQLNYQEVQFGMSNMNAIDYNK